MSSIIHWCRSNPVRAASLFGVYQQFCGAVAGIVVIPVILHTLGSEDAGLWFSIQGVILIFSLSDFGFSAVISRQVAYSLNFVEGQSTSFDIMATRPGWAGVSDIYRASRTIFTRVIVASFALFLITYLLVIPHTQLAAHLNTANPAIWYVTMIGLALLVQVGLSRAFLDGIGLMYIGRFVGGTYQMVYGIATIVVLLCGGGVLAVACTFLVCASAHLLVMYLFFRKAIGHRLVGDLPVDRRIVRKLCAVAVPYGVMTTGGYLVSAVQVPLLGVIMGPLFVTPIYTALKISQILNALVLQAMAAHMPAFASDIARGNWSAARTRMKITTRLGVVLQVLATIAILLVSKPVVDRWLGPGHYISGATLLVFGINYGLTGVAGALAQFVFASGRNPFMISTLMHGALTVVGMILLCPRIGMLGVPLAGLIGVAVTNLWLNPLEAWRTWNDLRRGAGAAC